MSVDARRIFDIDETTKYVLRHCTSTPRGATSAASASENVWRNAFDPEYVASMGDAIAPEKEPRLRIRPRFLCDVRMVQVKRHRNAPLDHARQEHLRDLERAVDVDREDVVHLALGGVDEVYRHGVRLANVVD
jgi:hypothetical protein